MSSAQAKFKFGNVVLVSKLVDGKFPTTAGSSLRTIRKLKLAANCPLASVAAGRDLTSDSFAGAWVLGDGSLKIS